MTDADEEPDGSHTTVDDADAVDAQAADADARDAGVDDTDARDADLFDYADAAAPDDPQPSRDTAGAGAPPASDGADADPAAEVPGVDDLDRDGTVRLGVELIEHLELSEPSLAAVIDRIETVTTNPTLTREILDAAEKRGLIERDGARVRTRSGGTFVRFERQVVRREGDFDCRRCGASLSTGHFVRLESGELGPFGSSCVRKVTGRE